LFFIFIYLATFCNSTIKCDDEKMSFRRGTPCGEGGNNPINHYIKEENTGGGGNATGWWHDPSPECSCGATLF
jgi:hypothetical protein